MAGMTTSKPDAEMRAALFERLAERLQQAGVQHPIAATVALVARGDRGLSKQEFAAEVGVAIEVINSAESGDLTLQRTLAALGEAAPADVNVLIADLGI